MSEFITFHFVNCMVRYFPAADYLETIFSDGEKCPAQFTFTPNDLCKAVDLGYPAGVSGVTRLHLEHELSHTFIAEALGEPWCPVLRSVAVKGPCAIAWEREALVLEFQRYLNTLERGLLVWNLWAELQDAREEFCRRFRK